VTLQSKGRRAGGGDAVSRRIRELAPWFHNLHLPSGHETASDHPLGDFPTFKWDELSSALPPDLTGWSALDVGCNAGFYSFELARRGATVLGVDRDAHYLRQARWAARLYGLGESVRFERRSVYQLARDERTFDLVLFLGVLYHLRHPLLALDILAEKTRRVLVVQTLTMPGRERLEPPADVDLVDRTPMLRPGWPVMAFVEHSLANDPTNWWAPNAACVEAMLRSCGLRVVARPADETWICEPSAPAPRFDAVAGVELDDAAGRV
jgi:tRNA (mo5U34)-methyltransferase